MNHFSKIKRVLQVILIANLGVAILKIIIGNIIKSTSLTADGFHSLTDASSNVVGLFGIHLASKPEDEDHPYGHGKFETVTGLFIAAMLFLLGGKIILEAILRIPNPVAPNVSLESLIVLIVTLGVNIFVATYEFKQGKELKSDILISDATHTKSDIYISTGVLITLLSIKLGFPPIIDPIISLIISLFIFHASYEIFQSTSSILVDRVVIDADRIREIVMSFDAVKECHRIRSRGREDDIHVDLHIMTNPNMSVEESHNLTHDIEETLQQEFGKNIQVISHIEPFYGKPRNEHMD